MPHAMVYTIYFVLIFYVIFRLIKPAASLNTAHVLLPLLASLFLIVNSIKDTIVVLFISLNLILYFIFSIMKSRQK